MPLLILLGVGAVGGYLFHGSSDTTLSSLEGVVIGMAIGVSAAAVYFALKKV